MISFWNSCQGQQLEQGDYLPGCWIPVVGADFDPSAASGHVYHYFAATTSTSALSSRVCRSVGPALKLTILRPALAICDVPV